MSTRNDVVALARILVARLRRPVLTLAGLALVSLLAMGAIVAAPMAVGDTIDALALGSHARFAHALVVFLSLVGGQVVLSLVAQYAFSINEERVGWRLRADIATALLSRAQSAPLNVGDATARVVSDTQQIKSAVSSVLLQPAIDAATVGVAGAVLIWQSPLVGAATLLVAPLAVLANRALARRLEDNAGRSQIAVGRMIDVVQSWLSRAPWVRLFGVLGTAEARVGEQSGAMFELARRGVGLHTRIVLVASIVMVLPQALILSLGGHQALAGEVSVGTLVSLIGLAALIMPPLNRLVSVFSVMLPHILPSLRRVREALGDDGAAGNDDEAGGLPVRELRVRGLEISVPEAGATPLSIPDLVVRRGEVVRLCGRNGSGKSTFLAALAGLRPSQGTREVTDGVGQRRLRTADVALAPAEPIFFDGSVEENILLFRPATDDSRGLVDWACRRLDGGAGLAALAPGLSRGEQQRIVLARAFNLGRPVLLLDEPSTGLDDDAVAELVELVSCYRARGAVLIVTHDERLGGLADRSYRAVREGDEWQIHDENHSDRAPERRAGASA